MRFLPLLMLALLWAPAARGEDPAPVQTTTNAAEDLQIDVTLKALREPLPPPDDVEGRGAPVWPLYKEEPPAAQQDFRPPPPPEPPPVRRDDREEPPDEQPAEDPPPAPPPQPPPPPPLPCTPNHPNWPNC